MEIVVNADTKKVGEWPNKVRVLTRRGTDCAKEVSLPLKLQQYGSELYDLWSGAEKSED
jgi:hypothetical protein